jgi:hypothetical protein
VDAETLHQFELQTFLGRGWGSDINPLKPKLTCIIFKHSARTAKKTPHFTVTKINWLTLFKEIIAVCCENHMKQINTLWVKW